MNREDNSSVPSATTDAAPELSRTLTPAAQRALKEADERRKARDASAKPAAPELGGRAGLDPVRYGDWETGGIASDF
jgi:hypothetical protein